MKDATYLLHRIKTGLEELLEQSPIYYRRLLTSVFLSSLATWGLVFFNIYVLAQILPSVARYGIALFFVMPFFAGILPVAFYALKHPVSRMFSLFLGNLTIILIGLELLLFKFEGLICLLMAAPIGFIMAGLGAYCAYLFFKRKNSQDSKNKTVFFSVILALPLLMLAERHPLPLPIHHVTTSIEVSAPAQEVWKYVIAFPKLKEPTAWWFKAGIAHPKGAVIKGHGVGAIRYCQFTTGPFIEPITHWDPPHHLGFDVAKQPPSMKELSPWGNIHPPHLDNYFQSKRGQFILTSLPNGKTKIEGTTWYTIDIWPQAYWTMWSNFLIHAIHYEVLNHIKTQVEQKKSKEVSHA
jgi:hypothetical protein